MSRILESLGIDETCRVTFSDFVLCRELEKKELDGEKMKNIIKRAEAALEAPLNVLPVSHYKLYHTKGDRREMQRGYFERRGMALNLAYAESYERSGRFTEKLVDVIWAIMEETTWVIPAHHSGNTRLGGDRYLPSSYNYDQLHGICILSAATAAVLSMVYYLCGDILDDFSPVINERIKFSIKERITKPYIQCRFWWDGETGGKVLNWCPWITSNILLAVGLTEEDEYLRSKVLKKAILAIDTYADTGVMADGGCDEGPGYWGSAGASYFECLELLYDFSGGKVDIFKNETVRKMMEFILKVNVNGKRFLNFSDSPPEIAHDGAMLRRMGEKCGSEVLKSFGDTMTGYNVHDGEHFHPYRGYRNLITKAKEGTESLGFTKVWLPEMKIMLCRENQRTDKGMLVAMTGGANGTAHSHNDIGNVTVYYNGNPVLIDAGSGVYTKKTFSDERYSLWYMQSCYHNVADINGKGQKNGWAYRSENEVWNDNDGSVSMELARAYEKEAGVKSYIRTLSLNGGVAVIKDKFSLEEKGEIDIHFITHKKPQPDNGKIILCEGRVMTFDQRLTPFIEEFQTEDAYITSYWGSETLYRIHLKAEVTEGEFIVSVK